MILASLSHSVSAARELTLGKGKRILDFGIYDDERTYALVTENSGLSIVLIRGSDGRSESLIGNDILTPILGKNSNHKDLRLRFSPRRRYFVLFSSKQEPQRRPAFSVITLQEKPPRALHFIDMPADFWVSDVAWDQDDNYLYVSRVPYTNFTDDIAIGRLNIDKKSFLSIFARDKLDLIEQIAFNPRRSSIIAVAHSYDKLYPKEYFIVEASLKDYSVENLGTAPYLSDLFQSDTGEELLFTVYPTDANGDNFIDSEDDSDIYSYGINAGASVVIRNYFGVERMPKASPDGNWIGFLRSYKYLDIHTGKNSYDLWFAEKNSGRDYFGLRNVSDYFFSSNGKQVYALSADGTKIHLIEMPLSK